MMKLTSTFNPVLSFILLLGFISFWSLLIIGIPIGMASASDHFQLCIGLILALLIVAAIIAAHIRKRNYAMTFYEFDEEKIIYFDGFFNPTRKEIFYKRILEVDFKQGFLQKQFGLGTIVLVTNSASSNQQDSGINVPDIANPAETYDAVKKLIYARIKAG
jgi:membrane protein YdbS with pleckstrin-like domain